jgi:hypothetical protein
LCLFKKGRLPPASINVLDEAQDHALQLFAYHCTVRLFMLIKDDDNLGHSVAMNSLCRTLLVGALIVVTISLLPVAEGKGGDSGKSSGTTKRGRSADADLATAADEQLAQTMQDAENQVAAVNTTTGGPSDATLARIMQADEDAKVKEETKSPVKTSEKKQPKPIALKAKGSSGKVENAVTIIFELRSQE